VASAIKNPETAAVAIGRGLRLSSSTAPAAMMPAVLNAKLRACGHRPSAYSIAYPPNANAIVAIQGVEA
jgi:hypothetical protein